MADLFGIRVLDVDLDRREVELRVLVVFCETDHEEYLAPPERDPGFFCKILWPADEVPPRPWFVENSRWFIERAERTHVRNHPPTEMVWDYLSSGGGNDYDEPMPVFVDRGGLWPEEDLLPQADYVVRVADARWIEHLKPGLEFGVANYPIGADCPDPDDLPHVPNPHRRVTRRPFQHKTPGVVAFSDDSRLLAVTAEDGKETVLYERDDWSEHERLRYRPLWTSSPSSPDGGYLVETGEVNHDPYSEEAGDEVVVRRAHDGVAVIHHWPGGYVPGIAWSPDGRWLALAVESLRGGGEVQVMPIGLSSEPPPELPSWRS